MISDAFQAQRIKLSPIAGGGFPALIVRTGSAGSEISIHGPKVLALPTTAWPKRKTSPDWCWTGCDREIPVSTGLLPWIHQVPRLRELRPRPLGMEQPETPATL